MKTRNEVRSICYPYRHLKTDAEIALETVRTLSYLLLTSGLVTGLILAYRG